jgi:phage protein D
VGENINANPYVKITAGGDVETSDFLSYTVDRDIFQPDMAAIVVSNQGDKYSEREIGAAVEIKIGDKGTKIFQGEIVALEPTYKGGEKTKMLIRAMNKMHRLLRKRKSITFTDKTDKDILNAVCGDAGLSLDWSHDKSITYKHVYQHNQTDLEFLRTRAARMGCHVWCVDSTVHCKQPKWEDSGIELSVDKSDSGHPLLSFSPRLSSAAIVKKVTVKGWNPETKELITGEANIEGPLGSTNASAASKDLGKEETFTVDHPIWSKEEADALAKARLQDLALSFVTGEAEVAGKADAYELGKCVKITANGGKSDDPFNGKYYIMGLTHRHMVEKKGGHGGGGGAHGFTTILRIARNAVKP